MPIRETFWNIPHWAEITQYVLGGLTVLIFIIGMVWRVRRWRMGQAEKRTDKIGTRLMAVLTQGIAQIRTLEDVFAGIMHLTIFWGMVVLVIGTALATVDWDVTRLFFDFQFLTGGVYIVYELVLDIFALFLVVGVGMAAYRRYIVRPPKLKSEAGKSFAWDDTYVIVMLALIAISGYLVEGLRIAVTEPTWAAWSPVGNAIASLMVSLGDPTNSSLHFTIWIIHALVAFVSIASIPFTKFFHAIVAPANIFFQSLEPKGVLAPVRSISDVGVKQWQDFTWKQLLDIDACLRCGRCHKECPAQQSGLAFSPRDIMIKLKKHMWASGNGQELHGDILTLEEVWGCITCLICTEVCPIFTDIPASIVDLRRYLVIEGRIDEELQEALMNLERYGNSFGQSPRARAKWSQREFKIKDARREAVEYLWYLGDYASYSPSLTEVTQITAKVFQSAGVDFGILFDGEQNSGNDVRRVGEEGLFEMLVEKNQKTLGRAKFKTIVTTDPHTYNTLKNEYPAYNGSYEVLHYTELLDHLIATGQLRFSKKLDYKVTYHDPCYLGRYNDIYDAPRRVIAATGCELIEMPHNRDRALCCGAGGGRIWMAEGQIEERPSEIRVREAVELNGVSAVVVTCPKDITMFQDAIKTTGNEEKIVVKDLIELVHEAL
jgi:Fe-S oxidoreductase